MCASSVLWLNNYVNDDDDVDDDDDVGDVGGDGDDDLKIFVIKYFYPEINFKFIFDNLHIYDIINLPKQ